MTETTDTVTAQGFGEVISQAIRSLDRGTSNVWGRVELDGAEYRFNIFLVWPNDNAFPRKPISYNLHLYPESPRVVARFVE